ncbi:dihydroxyacetone kinase Dak1 [Mycotypha africana]|uniref:dihydroxyacetone kinase Dak1 n=1 Tax=Mycotypha africana TaxID=64632 RepID=UPI0023003770|nr:dihydroxyacetone kinase Dak1 [Mycotypha africana]KAI8975288.1 dihydroxyacetone kinase Dak1 [Mycotypha africana]
MMVETKHSAAKHVMNAPENLVSDSIKGLCYANPHLRLLEEDKVVYYANVDEMAMNQVTIISGGGSGHEPGYAGLVGENCLAANVCGHVFASPSSSQVLHAIERVQSPHGTLVIIMNYTGDCLNFGLAVERAKARGIKVDLIAVGDDVAVGRSKGGKVGRRGMAATTLAIKLAGALAAKGAKLEQVRAMAQYAIDHSATLGVAFDHCHVPGSTSFAQLGPDEMELGMGIHNETGFLKTNMMPAHELVVKMMDMLVDQKDEERAFIKLPADRKTSVVLLVNNLGGTAMVELNLVVKEAVDYLMKMENISVERVYTGPFVTSLNMPGFSISLLTVDHEQKLLELLDEPVRVAGWPLTAAREFNSSILGDNSAAKKSPEMVIDESKGKADAKNLETAIRSATEAVIAAEPRITDYDTVLGDGDCGHTLKTAALAIQEGLKNYDLTSAAKTILGIADTIERSVGGTSSAIYCIFFNALASGIVKNTGDKSTANAHVWVAAARHALATLMTYTKARIGDRTLMDTLCPFIDTLNNDASNLKEAVKAARDGAQSTCNLTAKLGRSSYLSNKEVMESGIPDAGAYGLAEILTGLANALNKN